MGGVDGASRITHRRLLRRLAAMLGIALLGLVVVVVVGGRRRAVPSAARRSARPPSVPVPTDPGRSRTHDHAGDGSSSMLDVDPPRPARPEELRALAVELEAARQAVPYRTVREAEADGFHRTSTDPDHPDDHLVRDDRVDPIFEITAPEMLLTSSNDPDGRIVAAVYWVESEQGAVAPEGFTGPLDGWHHHGGACLKDGEVVADGDAGDPARCVAEGGTVVSPGGWMVHAWVFPEFANPDGTFRVNNPALVPSG